MNSQKDVMNFLKSYGARDLLRTEEDGTTIELWGFGKPYKTTVGDEERLPLVIWVEHREGDEQSEENEPITIVPFFGVSEEDMLNLIETAKPPSDELSAKFSAAEAALRGTESA